LSELRGIFNKSHVRFVDCWETFEKYSILFKFKEGGPAMAGLTAGIHGVFRGLKSEPDTEFEQKGVFCNGLAEE
jgi:hypothetical protein